MTFALDATYSTGRNLSGVGVYCREMLNGLAGLRPQDRFQWCYRPHRLRQGLCEQLPVNAKVRPLMETFAWGRPEFFHGLNQRMPRWKARRRVCTFHDLFVLTSEYSTAEFRQRFSAQAREAAERADLIIAVSEFTAGQAHELLNVERSRLRVVPHGARFPDRLSSEPREAMILHVGAVQHRKNLIRLVEAFEQAAEAPWRLVLAGSHGFGAGEILARVASSPAKSRIELPGYIDDVALETYYRRASVFAFPSLDEGFGIPVLEAMGQGIPVLSSNRSALPEACGDAALLVDPFSTDEIADGLQRLMTDALLRNELTERGRRRAAEYTWARAIRSTWSVYEELMA